MSLLVNRPRNSSPLVILTFSFLDSVNAPTASRNNPGTFHNGNNPLQGDHHASRSLQLRNSMRLYGSRPSLPSLACDSARDEAKLLKRFQRGQRNRGPEVTEM